MATPISNLPTPAVTDSAESALKFFNTYYQQGISVSANSVDAAISFFRSRGFSETAANSVAAILIVQAKSENIDVFKLIDTLKDLNGVQLSRVVAQILNYNRLRISTLGTRVDNTNEISYVLRNVIP